MEWEEEFLDKYIATKHNSVDYYEDFQEWVTIDDIRDFIIEQRKQAKLEVLDEVLKLDKVVMNDKAWIRLVDIEKVKSEL